jgi:hypothetical protein
VPRMQGLLSPAPIERKLEYTNEIAKAALDIAENCAKVLEKFASSFDDEFWQKMASGMETFRTRAISEHARSRLVEINNKKKVTPGELADVKKVYKELAPQSSNQSELHVTISKRLNMPERRVRTIIEKLGLGKKK